MFSPHKDGKTSSIIVYEFAQKHAHCAIQGHSYSSLPTKIVFIDIYVKAKKRKGGKIQQTIGNEHKEDFSLLSTFKSKGIFCIAFCFPLILFFIFYQTDNLHRKVLLGVIC